ncbi:laccase domain protein [Deinococcus ruber]|uniref:Laccase domain protein n=2 Tax=Deinococcus ruber TaxID=1848197 RepID=A0A918F2D0_9DEIO|nr:laccase domain protein [Deinococcus ruber]
MNLHTPSTMFVNTPQLTAPHGFSLRAGGVSVGAYAGLNLDDREDDRDAVAQNRELLAGALGFRASQVSRLNQVHGLEVVRARPGEQTADAQVSAEAGILLAIGTADCYPVLLEDPQARVLGAAHAGWRGTLGRIAARTVDEMVKLGARPDRIRAAVGPGICAAQYPVGAEVAAAFAEAGMGEFVGPERHLDLCAANLHVLRGAGVLPQHLWAAGRCSTEADFYSYRRDAGKTGRMWAVIGYPAPGVGAGVPALAGSV